MSPRGLFPRTLKARAILVLTSLFIVSQALSLYIFDRSRYRSIIMTEAADLSDRIAGIVQLANNFSGPERQEILRAAETQFLSMFPDVVPVDQAACQDDAFARRISQRLDESLLHLPALTARICVRSLSSPLFFKSDDEADGFDVIIVATFPDGEEILFHALLPPPTPLVRETTVIILLAVGLGALLLAWLLMQRVVLPIERLAHAADRIGTDIDAEPIEERGPQEARVAAAAFNRMQERLARLVHGQTEMLAAISHDLRTAVTRLQLRAELIENREEREGMLRVVEDMREMTRAVLAFLRGYSADEEARPMDIGSLVESLCEDLGHENLPVVCRVETEPAAVRCRPTALRRAVQNLIDNAVRYGNRAEVTVTQDAAGESVVITVDDDGPGIAAEQRESVLQPFVRLDRSRNEQTGGIGLGLSITQNIVQSHGGTLTLTDSPAGGLRTQLRLPVIRVGPATYPLTR